MGGLSKVGLGIDTGGTFTDAVLWDLDGGRIVAKAKSPTTYDDLALGISSAIDLVLQGGEVEVGAIKMVGISTTLATNSLLQGKGGEVGLVGIGWRPDPEWNFGVKHQRFIKGGYDSIGRQSEPMDPQELEMAILEVSEDVDALVVSGLFSVCNGWQEIQAAEEMRRLTRLPIIMGQSFTAELGIFERTVTAVLNSKLLNVIADFLDSMERSLDAREVKGRIFVLKGDGGLMSLQTARERPVEMVLSGPAASLMGGKALAGLDDCLVIDMGGTSTDIAYLDEGFPRLNVDGAVVGQWRTRVKGIDMWTCGLGGDSLVRLDKREGLLIGPERVLPLAMASARFPGFRDKIAQEGELQLYLALKHEKGKLTDKERRIHEFIEKNGPSTYYDVIKGVENEYVVLQETLESMKSRGFLLKTGLTPTDTLHHLGRYVAGDKEAACFGIRFMAERAGEGSDELAMQIMKMMVTRVGEEIIKKAIMDAGAVPNDGEAFQRLLRSASGHGSIEGMGFRMDLGRPIVGIGAPAIDFIKPLEGRLASPVMVPEGHEVGNAVGAVSSYVSETFMVQVTSYGDKYVVLAPMSSPSQYSHFEEAMSSARSYGTRVVKERLARDNLEDLKVRVEVLEKKFPDGYGKEMKFLNWVDLRFTAMGRPKLPE